MVIFHSYVSLPEGIWHVQFQNSSGGHWTFNVRGQAEFCTRVLKPNHIMILHVPSGYLT